MNKTKKRKNYLDEMKEQKLLCIYSRGYHIALWGLAAVIIIQMAITDCDVRTIIGEVIVILAMAIYTIYASLKNGIWERRFQPSIKSNLLISLIPSVIFLFAVSIRVYLNYQPALWLDLFCGGITAIFTFILCFVVLSITAAFYKKRLNKLENVKENEQDA